MTSLLYNAETWADANVNGLEVKYRRILKCILGVSKTTCSEFLYIELGVLSIKVRIKLKQWNFWRKISQLDEENPLKHVIDTARIHDLKEYRYYENLSRTYTAKEEIIHEFFEETRSSIRRKAESGRSKYITYMEINPLLETPKCYYQLVKKRQVSMIAKLRMSCHNLQIEMGRRTNIPRDLRLCCCGEEIEDESHFLLRCRLYSEVRRKHGINEGFSLYKLLNGGEYVYYVEEISLKRNEFT